MKVVLQFVLIVLCALGAVGQTQDAEPVRANGVMLLVSQVTPTYPPLARQARIQGEVRLSVLVDRSGGIKNVSLIRGHPMLAPAAVAAVKQWRFEPLLLNGNPVEVSTEIKVLFLLQP